MKFLSTAKNKFLTACIAVSGIVSGSSMAADTPVKNGADLSPLTDSIDFTNVLIAILSIAGAIAALYAGYVGVRWILRMIKGA